MDSISLHPVSEVFAWSMMNDCIMYDDGQEAMFMVAVSR